MCRSIDVTFHNWMCYSFDHDEECSLHPLFVCIRCNCCCCCRNFFSPRCTTITDTLQKYTALTSIKFEIQPGLHEEIIFGFSILFGHIKRKSVLCGVCAICRPCSDPGRRRNALFACTHSEQTIAYCIWRKSASSDIKEADASSFAKS